MARILRGGKQVIIVVLRHSTLPGHLGLHQEHVLEEAHQLEFSMGQGVTLFLELEHRFLHRTERLSHCSIITSFLNLS